MAGKTENETKDELDKRKLPLEQIGFEVANTYIEDSLSVKNLPLWCLGRSLEIMSDCDVAYFCEGWQKARGCLVEYEAAVQYGLQVITED